jgi:hypothetical protein
MYLYEHSSCSAQAVKLTHGSEQADVEWSAFQFIT